MSGIHKPKIEEIYETGLVAFSRVIATPAEGYAKRVGGHSQFLSDLKRVAAIAAGQDKPDFEPRKR